MRIMTWSCTRKTLSNIRHAVLVGSDLNFETQDCSYNETLEFPHYNWTLEWSLFLLSINYMTLLKETRWVAGSYELAPSQIQSSISSQIFKNPILKTFGLGGILIIVLKKSAFILAPTLTRLLKISYNNEIFSRWRKSAGI